MAQFFRIDEIGIKAWPFELGQDADQIAVGRQQIIRQGRNPQTGFGRAENAVNIVQLQNRAHVRFELLGSGHHPVDVRNWWAGIRTINDQPVIFQIFGCLGHAVLFDIFRRRKDVIAQGHQLPLYQIGLTRWLHADGDIGLTHGKIKFLVIEDQRQFDFRIAFQEFIDARSQPGRAKGHRGGDFQRAARPFLGFTNAGFGHGKLGKDVMGGAIQQLALFGQNQATGMAVKKRNLDAFFKRADLSADSRLA